MANAKIEFTLGNISFSGEGEEGWLANQLDKIIDRAPDLMKIAPEPITSAEVTSAVAPPTKGDTSIAAQTLPNYLKSKNATKGQLQKHLATAIWLEAKGKTRISTSDITNALKDSNQSRLGNPSDCLNKNVAKGFIEKDGKLFFVTEEGKASL